VVVTFLRNLEAEPGGSIISPCCDISKRTFADRPRIGDSAARREDFVQLGQDPFMDFPASNLARVVQSDDKPLKVFVKYLGLLGPQGALPLATTEEAYHYVLAQDDAFPRFLRRLQSPLPSAVLSRLGRFAAIVSMIVRTPIVLSAYIGSASASVPGPTRISTACPTRRSWICRHPESQAKCASRLASPFAACSTSKRKSMIRRQPPS